MPISSIEPYNVQTDKNSALLSLLGTTETTYIRSRHRIPIPANVDFSSIIKANNSKILNNTNDIPKDPQGTQTSEEVSQVEHVSQNLTLSLFVNVNDFLPSNFQEQVCTVTIKNFPVVLELATESVLMHFFDKTKFSWSIIENSNIENRLIFIRFSSIDHLRWFLAKNVQHGFHEAFGAQVYTEPLAGEYLKDLPEEPFSASLAPIRALLAASKADKGDDAGLDYYNKYKVDEQELIEVPKDLKEDIKRDIIRFRTKVLKDEKENRRKEAEAERIRTKNKLKSLFLDAVKQDDEPVDTPMTESAEHEEMDDAQYDAFLKEESAKKYHDLYQTKVSALDELEKSQRAVLAANLERERSYEKQVLDSKLQILQQWKNFDDEKIDPDLPARFRLYYTNHPEYLRLRAKEREQEEALDAADEEAEKKELAAHENASQFLSSFVKENVTENTPTKNSVSNVVFANLDTESLRSKICDLVEEFLGVKEDFVIDFIYKHLIAHNFEKNQELIDELTEILDEDAVTVIERLKESVSLLQRVY